MSIRVIHTRMDAYTCTHTEPSDLSITPSDRVVASKPHWSACVHFPQYEGPWHTWPQATFQSTKNLNSSSHTCTARALTKWPIIPAHETVFESVLKGIDLELQLSGRAHTSTTPTPQEKEDTNSLSKWDCWVWAFGILLHKTFYISYFVINSKTRIWRCNLEFLQNKLQRKEITKYKARRE